jgi:hypothetical protein
MKLKNLFIAVIFAVTFLSSCTMERKLAMQFVDGEAKGYPVMLVPPDILYFFNEKAPPFGNYTNVDSALFYSSKYLQYTSDSAFLEKYFDSFISHAKKNGLSVYLPTDLQDFIETDRASYIVRFANMELIEDTMTFQVEEKINNRPRIKEIPYETISLRSWFEISMKDSANYYTYYDEQYLTDEIYGQFEQQMWTMDIKYDYTKYEIEKEDIYYFAQAIGKSHASYLFDLMLNSYIWSQLPEDRRSSFYYLHYNTEYRSIEVAEDAFIMVEEK